MKDKKPRYVQMIWWCNTHQRFATYCDTETYLMCCDPSLPGITLPCQVVNLTGLVEIKEEDDTKTTPPEATL